MHAMRLVAFAVLPALIAAGGCTSIHSGAVRDLIAIQGTKIDAATEGAKKVQAATGSRIDAIKKARADLDTALRQQQASQHVYALVFSSGQNVGSKTGIDALAVAYLVGEIYLVDVGGIEETAAAQFDRDLDALADVAARLGASWAALKKTQDSLSAYAARTGLASVDAALVAAIIEQTPGTSEKADSALRAARKLDDALGQIGSVPILRSGAFGQGRAVTTDLIDLLERAKK